MGSERQRVDQTNFRRCILIGVSLICLYQTNGADAEMLTPDDSNKIDLNCSYESGGGPFHGCLVYNVNLTTNAEVASVTGSNLPGKPNKNVGFIQFVNGTMFSIPSGLGTFFENVWMVIVGGGAKSQGYLKTKFINRSGFMHWNKLQAVTIYSNDTLEIDENAFIDLPLLDTFGLTGNGSLILLENTFQKNENLRRVYIEDTYLEPLHKNIFRNNSLLWRIELINCSLNLIPENLLERNTKLIMVRLSSNKIEYLPRNLFKNTLNLRYVDFSKNALKTIEIDFNSLHNIIGINLKDNSCISFNYQYDFRDMFIKNQEAGGPPFTFDEFSELRLSKLIEFQKEINANCNVHRSDVLVS